jgi:hypothetical protein
MLKMKVLLKETRMDTEIHTFEGDHKIDDEVLKRWIEKFLHPPLAKARGN